jgi:O-antigen/teichoic acid export membrane protein
VAALLLRDGGVAAAVLAYVASTAALLLLGIAWVVGALRRAEPAPLRPSGELLRFGLGYGLRGHAGVLFSQLTYRFDQVLVTRMLGIEAQGLYSIAVLLAEKLGHIPASVQLVLFPRVSGLSSEEANRLTPRACRLTLSAALLAAAFLFALGETLIRLFYSEAFLGSLPAFHALLAGTVALSLTRPLSGDLSGRNRRLAPTIATAAAFLVNLALDLLWIPRHGIVGAAWASTVAYALQSALLVAVFWRVTGVGPRALFVPTREDLRALSRAARRPPREAA